MKKLKKIQSRLLCNQLSTKLQIKLNDVIDINRFKSFKKIVLVTSYVYRFINNCRKTKSERLYGNFTNSERNYCESSWVKSAQQEFSEKHLSQLNYSLGVFSDHADYDILKLKGRLKHSELPDASKFPIILPKNCLISELIIWDAHNYILHSGVKDTLTEVRSKYWIMQGRSLVKRLLRKCILCRKYDAKLFEKLKSCPLPDYRSKISDPFTFTGIDYIGPVYVYPTPSGQNKKLEKVMIIIYTRASTRAVYLDVVPDNSSASLVRSLQRFKSRRGSPKLVISDNAKCFKGSSFKKYIQNEGIDWEFILERSQWWEGF